LLKVNAVLQAAGNSALYQGTTLVVPYNNRWLRALAPEVRFYINPRGHSPGNGSTSRTSAAKQGAESRKPKEKRTSGAKSPGLVSTDAARLKSCPDAKQNFSAACLATEVAVSLP
jgi:hypothetical protein